MFIGHYGIALAAKRLAPKTSLATLVLAAEFADMLWPIFLMAGIKRPPRRNTLADGTLHDQHRRPLSL
jgi:hypothetical protein